ncbi:MAG: hypothetical protein LIQ31_14095 [Planctomycetes bacterium]|nr:hypothetical protein [Planctomycetota bacterium]
MLRVPELKPDDQPFDPDTRYTAGVLKPSDHYLKVGKAAPSASVLTAATPAASGAGPGQAPTPSPSDPEAERRAVRDAVYDDAIVRDALAGLHERGNAFRREIESGPGREAASLDKRTDEFLKEQRKDLAADFRNDRQKALFTMGFDAYTQQTASWREAVRDEKTALYEQEVNERQRAMFRDLAVGRDTLFDDQAQSRYRDMILLSVDNELRDAPAEARQAALDAADGEFCRLVLDRRLEEDPTRTRPLLDSPAVRRVIGEDGIRRYEDQVAVAVRRDELAALGRQWSADNIPPDEAKRQAESSLDEPDREAALGEYRRLRQRDNRALLAANRQFVESAWKETDPAGGPDADRRLASLRRTDPDLADQFEAMRAEKATAGAAPSRPDYARLLELTDDFDADKAAELLRNREEVVKLYRDLGPDSDGFATYLKLADGSAGQEDVRRLDSLRRARAAATRLRGDDLDKAALSDFLHRYSEDARIYRERHGYPELDSGEEQAILQKTAAAMGWTGGDGGATAERGPTEG